MERRKFTPFVTSLVAAVLIGSSTMGVMAAPEETNATEIIMTDLDVQGKILYTAEVDADSAYFNKGIADTQEYAPVYMAANDKSKVVGKMYNTAVCDILERTGVWYKVSSGDVNGYVKTTDLKTGKAAEKLTKELGLQEVTLVAEKVGSENSGNSGEQTVTFYTAEEYKAAHPDVIEVAVEAVQVSETAEETSAENQNNEEVAAVESEYVTETAADTEVSTDWTESAEQETETTAVETEAPVVETETSAAETEAAVTETEVQTEENASNSFNLSETWETVYTTDYLNLRADAGLDAGILGIVNQGDSVVRTGIADNGWSRVDYNGTTGYVLSEYLTYESPDQAITEASNEETEEPAYEESTSEEPTYVEPTYEESTSEETTSEESSSSNSSTYDQGVAIVNYARQFLGNPYVYGGTSLTNGADCSGFVQTLYADFGISINRTATTQTYNGYAVSVDELQPGDLIMYGYGGEIEHVAMYEGNGMIIHASTEETGIIESSMYFGWDIYACRRIFQ